MSVTLQQLGALAGGTVYGAGELEVDSISLDSAAAAAGGVFAAVPGTRAHGAQYAAAAASAAVLTDAAGVEILRQAGERRPILEVANVRAVLGTLSAEIYGHPTEQMTVIGVTGTSGKTTTSYLLEAGLLAAGKSVGLIGTTGTRINRQPVETKLTTPEAPKLQELFATMLAQGVTHVVMEVSSHALALGRVQGTRFAAGGFSNLSQDHLDFHPTMEDYFAAKALLFEPVGNVEPDADSTENGAAAVGAERAVICVDDAWGQQMANHVRGLGVPTTTVSTKRAADITALQTAVEPSGAQTVEVTQGSQTTGLRLPLPGDFNVANAALALGLADAVGIDRAAFISGLEAVAVPGRMERVDRGQDFIAVVDYAHKPAAVAAVLDTLREQLGAGGGRIGVVVGAGGDRDAAKRPIMGANAAARADFVVVTDDNPRTEDPAAIRAALVEGARAAAADSGAEVVEVASRAQAIDRVVAWARSGDAVIVVGKGHEVGQIYGAQTLHFDDREELARALEEHLAAAGDEV